MKLHLTNPSAFVHSPGPFWESCLRMPKLQRPIPVFCCNIAAPRFTRREVALSIPSAVFITSGDSITPELVEAIERGLTFNGGMRTLNAELLRAIFLGIPIPFPRAENPSEFTLHKVKIRSSGIRIESARISGKLDLDDLSGPGGASLPRLWFEHCIFDNEEGIKIRRCHLRSLTLVNCQLHELQGEEAVIDGPVKIRGIQRPGKKSIRDRTGQQTETWGTY